MQKRVTIKEVAKAAGVTHPTVSRVIHDNPRISDKTKQRVLRAMKRLHYRPNLIARSLVSNSTRILACIIPDLNPHVQPILRGVVDVCTGNDYGLMLFSTDYWTEEDISYMWVVDNWRVDGMVIYNVVYHEEFTSDIRLLQSNEIPFVFINKHLREKEVNVVGVDNFEAVFQAIAHLVNQGHTRIGLMNGSMMSVDGVERQQAFKEALATLGLSYDPKIVGCASYSDEQAHNEMRRILKSRRPPTAMFCASDWMAMGVMRAIEERGLETPRDIAVVGFDDLEEGCCYKPILTTLRPPLRTIGEQAVELLMKVMDEPARTPEQISLQAKLLVRASSG